MATTTERSNRTSVLRALSSSQKLHNHHHHHHNYHQRSASRWKLDLNFRFTPGKSPEPPAGSNKNRPCVCTPTTHPGSFRCNYHRRLQNEKIRALGLPKRHVRLNLRKKALMNILTKIGSKEAKRFRRTLEVKLAKPSFLDVNRRYEFVPRPSRFYAMHINQV